MTPIESFSSGRIIAKLRQIEVQLAQSKGIALACKEAACPERLRNPRRRP
jgi:hypothetical protein